MKNYLTLTQPNGKFRSFHFFIFLIANFITIINLNGQIINDNPCDTLPGGPFDLSVVLSHKGSTCGAIGYADDTLADFPNYYCNKLTEENAVWYKYKFKPGSEGIQIELLPITKKGNPTIEIFFGNKGFGCGDTLTNFKAGHCDSLTALFRFGSCDYYGEYAYIKIASTEAKCDSFQIKVKEIQRPCNVAEKCSDITSDHILSPTTGDDLDYVCLSGCFDLSCPESPNLPGCDFSQTPTVWYYIDTDNMAAQLFTTIESYSGTWQPIWSVFRGDCDSLINTALPGVGPPCSNGDASPDVQQTGADNAVEGYYVAVTYDPGDPPTGGDTGFEICAATFYHKGIDPVQNVNIKIIERENTNEEPHVDPEVGYMGPFNSGEEVLVHIDFHYDSNDFSQWLIGFCPDFGSGWEIETFDYSKYRAFGSPKGPANWHEYGTSCGPLASEYFEFLCTYLDKRGVLHVCNELCENCSACDKPYISKLDPLPSGWFWLSNGSNAGCNNSSCKPHLRWGIGSTQSDVSWDFPLKVRPFSSNEEFKANEDLQISFQTFSDAGAGCWEDPIHEFLDDKKQFGPIWKAIFQSNGLAENTFGDKLKIFPNPTDGKINIEFGETLNEIDLTLSDVIGKTLISENYLNSSSINLSINHPAGIYFIRIRSGDKYALVKVVKQ